MNKRFVTPFFLLWVLALAACSGATAPKEGSSTQNPPYPTITSETGWVIDTTGTIPAETEKTWETLGQTLSDHGFQLGLAVFRDCACDIAQYGTEFGRHNKLGDEELDNGMAVVIFLDKTGSDGKAPAIFFAVGDRLNIKLSASQIGRILDATFVSARSAGEWQRGVSELLTGVDDFLMNRKGIEAFQTPAAQSATVNIWLIVAFIVFVVILITLDVIYWDAMFIRLFFEILSAMASNSSGPGGSSGGSGGSFSGGGTSR